MDLYHNTVACPHVCVSHQILKSRPAVMKFRMNHISLEVCSISHDLI
jgi:hypothetical protein